MCKRELTDIEKAIDCIIAEAKEAMRLQLYNVSDPEQEDHVLNLIEEHLQLIEGNVRIARDLMKERQGN